MTDLYLDLETDKVLSEGQLSRHYGYSVDSLPEVLHVFSSFLALTHHSMAYREVRFVTHDPKYTHLSASALRHLAGVAEVRRILRAQREQWYLDAGSGFASERPDAVWESPNGDVAIEFDAGSYGATKIRQKVHAFSRFEAQIWGSSSRKRVAHLERFLCKSGEATPPIFAPWT